MAKIKKFRDINRTYESMVYIPEMIDNAMKNLFEELGIEQATQKQKDLLHTAIKAICVLEGNAMYTDIKNPSLEDWDKEKSKIKVHSRSPIVYKQGGKELTPQEYQEYLGSKKASHLTLHKGEIQKTIKDYQEIERKYAELMEQG